MMFNSPRLVVPQISTAAGSSRFYRTFIKVPITRACTKLRWCWANFYSDFSNPSEGSPGNVLNIEGVLLWVNGVSQAVTFNGASSYSIADGASVLNDVVTGSFAATDTIALEYVYNVPTSGHRVGGLSLQINNGEGNEASTTTLIANLGTTAPTGNQTKRTTFGPMFCVADGWTTEPVVLIIGDSTGGSGWEDDAYSIGARGATGWLPRALDENDGVYGRIAFGSIGSRGNSTEVTSAGGLTGLTKRLAALRAVGNIPFTQVHCGLVINDVNNAANALADVQSKLQAAWAFYAGQWPTAKITQALCLPITSSSNTGWAATGQTFPNTNDGPDPSVRSQVNDWLLTLPSPLVAVVDPRTTVQDANGKWLFPAYSGLLVGAITAASVSTVTLSAAPVVGQSLVFESGDATNADANADYQVRTVVANGPNFDVTVGRTIVKAHADGIAVKSAYTGDGIHPNSFAADMIADDVVLNWKQAFFASTFNPLTDISGLNERWDMASGVTLANNTVASWVGQVGGNIIIQPTESIAGTYTATGVGGLPGVTLDGVNDFLSLVPVPAAFPLTTAAGWIMCLVSQDALVADTTTRTFMAYGRDTSSRARMLQRVVVTGVNRLRISTDGNNNTDAAVDFSGVCAILGQWGSAAQEGNINGTAVASAAATLAATNNRLRVGAAVASTAANFGNGKVNRIYVGTGALSAILVKKLIAYELWRAGEQAKLPTTHPYRYVKP